MGKLTIKLPDDLEEKFRRAAMEKFGLKRGNLSDAATEAIEKWVKENEH